MIPSIYNEQAPKIYAQGLYEQSSTKKHTLGTRRQLNDGRVFHYCKAGGTALAPGKLICGAVNITERDDALHAAAIAPVGAREITVTLVGAVTANQFQDGYLAMINDDSQGCQYKIASHPVGDTVDIIIVLADPIRVATSATTDALLLKSVFKDLILNADEASFTIGVNPGMQDLAAGNVSLGNYFWAQTWGPALVLCGDSTGTVTKERVCFPDSTTGEFLTTTGGPVGDQTIGYMIYDGNDVVDTEYHQIMLTCIP